MTSLKSFFRFGILAGFLIVLVGCGDVLKGKTDSGSKSDAELVIANLAARERQNRAGLYILNYTNFPEEGRFTGIRLASGRLLSANDGRFKFEQSSSEPTKSYLIHYDPQGELLVIFPGLKRAFRAPAEILRAPEMLPVLASYDGLRILLGQAGIWSDPARSQFEVRRFGGVVIEPVDRPYVWHVEFQDDDWLFPIREIEAKKGGRRVVRIGRETLSYESLDYSKGGNGIPGQGVKGSQVNIVTWKFTFPKNRSSTEIQINPVGDSDANQLVEQGGLNAPEIPKDFRTEEITPLVLMNWLNIH